jgi:hypothetical protein
LNGLTDSTLSFIIICPFFRFFSADANKAAIVKSGGVRVLMDLLNHFNDLVQIQAVFSIAVMLENGRTPFSEDGEGHR